MLGVGRAIGETMTVLMVTGNAANLPSGVNGLLSYFLGPVRTMTATVALEMGDTVQGSPHYSALFAVGLTLFAITFAINLIADLALRRSSTESLRTSDLEPRTSIRQGPQGEDRLHAAVALGAGGGDSGRRGDLLPDLTRRARDKLVVSDGDAPPRDARGRNPAGAGRNVLPHGRDNHLRRAGRRLRGDLSHRYAGQNTFTRLIRLAIVNLAGVPSIVYGLFGFGLFVLFLHFGKCILAGSLTLALMVLPVVITSAEEALLHRPKVIPRRQLRPRRDEVADRYGGWCCPTPPRGFSPA